MYEEARVVGAVCVCALYFHTVSQTYSKTFSKQMSLFILTQHFMLSHIARVCY